MPGFRRVTLFGVFLALTAAISRPAGAQVIGIVTGLLGSATMQGAGSLAPEPLALNDEVHQGDILRTGSGARLRVTLRDASVLSLGADTELKLDHLALSAAPAEPGSFFTLAGGLLRAAVGRLRPGSLFEIHSPSLPVKYRRRQ